MLTASPAVPLLLAAALVGCAFLTIDGNDRVYGPVGGISQSGVELIEAPVAELRGAISRAEAIRNASTHAQEDANTVASASLGRITSEQPGDDVAVGPIAWVVVWEHPTGVTVIVVDAVDGTVFSDIGYSNTPR